MRPLRHVPVAILFISLIVASAGAQETTQQPPALSTPQLILNPEVKLLDQEGAGKLYQAGEHLVCVMEGTPAEMGYQHGRLLAKRAHQIIKEGYMVKALYNRGYTREYVYAQSERMEKHFPPEYIEEMKAIVKGLEAAGITDIAYEDVRTGVTQAEIMHHDPNSPTGCSNCAA